jgi:hypothetical protein
MSLERLIQAVTLSYNVLRKKIHGGRLRVDNEASLQLQFASILKAAGELLEEHLDEVFTIELEKRVTLDGANFAKSGSSDAKIDVFCAYTNTKDGTTHRCAIEIKHLLERNHREPNNRYDVFVDIRNLENYANFAECCFMLVATDHLHYVSQSSYSPDTSDFDFRNGKTYASGTVAIYRTEKPYGFPITLDGSYNFNWDTEDKGLHFMLLAVTPTRRA